MYYFEYCRNTAFYCELNWWKPLCFDFRRRLMLLSAGVTANTG
jgi:hypothetical protein